MTAIFKRLIISTRAKNSEMGTALVEWFSTHQLAVFEVAADEDVDSHPHRRQASSLGARARPASSWITRAEHGQLYVRPNEYYLHPSVGCRAACDYCFLNGRIPGRTPLTVHTDFSSLLAAVRNTCATSTANTSLLFATGELADSLNDIDVFPVAVKLVSAFGAQSKARLELRTKSEFVHPLLQLSHNRMTTVAFSIAPQSLIDRHEAGTASLDARLKAARLSLEAGYPVALKIEPVLLENNWRADYEDLFKRIRSQLTPFELEHFSIGCLRWSASLEEVHPFRTRFEEVIRSRELVPHRADRSNRTLPHSTRLAAYHWIRDRLRTFGLLAPIYWSLETPDMVRALELDGQND